MIRRAAPSDFPTIYQNESAIRIGSLKEAYGADAPFIGFFTDENGVLLSVTDGVGVLFAPSPLNREWIDFLSFYTDVTTLHTDELTGKQLMETGGWHGKCGDVFRFEGMPPSVPPHVDHAPSLPAVHQLESICFTDFPPLEAWYVDVSHRCRHGHCHVAAVTENKQPISVALTVAETETGAVLGQVATHPDFRCRGYARDCIQALIFTLQGKHLYILPAHEKAAKLYKSLGFRPYDRWAELKRT